MLATTITSLSTGSRRMSPRTSPSRRAARDRARSGRVPVLDAEMRAPAGVEHRRRGDLAHSPSRWNSSRASRASPGLQRKELRGHLQHAAIVRVEREGDDLVARHVEVEDRRDATGAGRGRIPPRARRLRVELRVVLAERRVRGLALPAGQRHAGDGRDRLQEGASADGIHGAPMLSAGGPRTVSPGRPLRLPGRPGVTRSIGPATSLR